MAHIFICGDIVNYENKDGLVCSQELAGVILSADYSICNFEAPVSGFGKHQPKSGPHHSQRAKTISGLKEQGFNLLLLANNHIMDFGPEGLSATLDAAQKVRLDTIGAGLDDEQAYAPLIREINRLKIGMINACEAQFGVIDHFDRKQQAGYAWINHPQIDKTVLRLKKECDFVIVFSHAGLEHYSIPQKEWRERYKHLCELGADVIVGSHPHVPQGYEIYKKSLIFYSLGNFYFDSTKYKDKEDPSFSLLLKFSQCQTPDFEPVYHYKANGLVQLSPPEKRIDIDTLCTSLGDDYESIHDAMSLEAYEKIRRNLIFSLMPIPYDGTLKGSLKRLASIVLGRRNKANKTLLQLHLIRNEAYYYAARHALEILARDKHTDL